MAEIVEIPESLLKALYEEHHKIEEILESLDTALSEEEKREIEEARAQIKRGEYEKGSAKRLAKLIR
ncbi:MAG TPA: hypothetical protein HA346_05960 [Thermoplasmata archaeon]|nr:hypothetical protein [Thermoplasmata archaeon]